MIRNYNTGGIYLYIKIVIYEDACVEKFNWY